MVVVVVMIEHSLRCARLNLSIMMLMIITAALTSPPSPANKDSQCVFSEQLLSTKVLQLPETATVWLLKIVFTSHHFYHYLPLPLPLTAPPPSPPSPPQSVLIFVWKSVTAKKIWKLKQSSTQLCSYFPPNTGQRKVVSFSLQSVWLTSLPRDHDRPSTVPQSMQIDDCQLKLGDGRKEC